MTINEETLNQALKVLTVFMATTSTPSIEAQVFHEGTFYVVEFKMRKVEE